MRVAVISSVLLLAAASLLAADNAAQITVSWEGKSEQLTTKTYAVVEGDKADVVRLDPYGNTSLPRSIRIVFESIPPDATGCGVIYKPGSRPQFKGFITSVVDGRHVLMLTANSGSEHTSYFSIVCYDDSGNVLASVDPGGGDENPAHDWP